MVDRTLAQGLGAASIFALEGPEAAGTSFAMRPRPTGGYEFPSMTIFSELLDKGVPEDLMIEYLISGRGQMPTEPISPAGAQQALERVRSLGYEPPPIGALTERRQREQEAERIAAMSPDLDIFAEEGPGRGSSLASVLEENVPTQLTREPKAPAGAVPPRPPARPQSLEVATESAPEPMPEADPVESAFGDAMEEFIQASGQEAPEVRDMDFYRKQFAEATGLDISGKPDKSAALMAFGLALMQNRAGKGFNIGNVLRSVGEAGEAALPALAKAREEARANAAAAGKYALEARSADQTKREAALERAKQRENYYIVPKGEGISGFLANADKGRLMPLNANELSGLQGNREFSSKYDILPASTWSSIVEEAMKAPEAKDMYLTSGRDVPLFEGAEDDILKVRVFDPDPNTNPNGRAVISGDGQQQYEALVRMARDNEKAKERFAELGALVEGQNIFKFGLDKLNAYASAFGVQFSENMSESQRIQMILSKLQAKNAPEILGEAGKTISDTDRARVAEIVGQLRAGTDPRELYAKVEELFNDIVLGAEADIRQGLANLNRYTGRNIGDFLDSGDMSEEERAELAEGLKALGIE